MCRTARFPFNTVTPPYDIKAVQALLVDMSERSDPARGQGYR